MTLLTHKDRNSICSAKKEHSHLTLIPKLKDTISRIKSREQMSCSRSSRTSRLKCMDHSMIVCHLSQVSKAVLSSLEISSSSLLIWLDLETLIKSTSWHTTRMDHIRLLQLHKRPPITSTLHNINMSGSPRMDRYQQRLSMQIMTKIIIYHSQVYIQLHPYTQLPPNRQARLRE